MKTIILGAGRRGIRLAKHLSEEKKDVVLIDEDQADVQQAMNKVDCLAVAANGTDIEELREIGLENSDAFIALTGKDETNLVSCGIASSEFGIKLTIAAVRNLSYTGKINAKNLLGISHIVNPSIEVAKKIYQDIDRGIYSDIISFDDTNLVLYNVLVDKKSKFAEKKLKNIRSSVTGRFIIAAINRDGQAIVPSGETTIKVGDTLSIVAKEDTVRTIMENAGKQRQKSKKIVIVGATEITDFLLRQFSPAKRKNITVVAKDPEACSELSKQYPECLVINGNISQESFFIQEGLTSNDLIICLTDNDELNILTASFAKNQGIPSSIAVINKNPDYKSMAQHLDIDSIISAQDVTIDSIAKFLLGANVSSTHSFFDGQIEAIAVEIPQNSILCGKALKDIDMRERGIIAGVTRDRETAIPDGKFIIQAGDQLVFVILRKEIDFMKKILGMGE